VPNRRLLAARLTSAIDHTDRHRSNLALVVLDVNDFKKINDTLGHVAGDQVLREVSATLRKSIRRRILSRGWEATSSSLWPRIWPTRLRGALTEALRSAVERPITINEQAMVVNVSFGYASTPRMRRTRPSAAAGRPAHVCLQAAAGGA